MNIRPGGETDVNAFPERSPGTGAMTARTTSCRDGRHLRCTKSTRPGRENVQVWRRVGGESEIRIFCGVGGGELKTQNQKLKTHVGEGGGEFKIQN